MGRLFAAALLAALALAADQAAAATGAHRIAFGGMARYGAYAVTIEPDGAVHAAGDGGRARVGVPQLDTTEIAALVRAAARARFARMPAYTRCPGAGLRSTTWILIGARKVTVRGICVPAYQRLFKALVTATAFFNFG